MKTLHLLRHGATPWNATGQLNSTTDIGLSDRGRQEILAIAPLVQGLALDRVMCSPRRRAQETAQLLALPLPINLDDRLRELDFGCFEGKTPAELAQDLPFQQWYWDANPQVPVSVESFESVADRAQAFLQDMATLPDNTILAIAHGALIRILLCHSVLGMNPHTYRRLRVDNGTLSTLVWDSQGLRLTALNCTSLRSA